MIVPIKRKGTARLLQVLKDCSEADRKEILAYIGELEQNEKKLFQAIDRLNYVVFDTYNYKGDYPT